MSESVDSVNGHRLPPVLCGVGEASPWVAARAQADVNQLPLEGAQHLRFLDVVEMKAHTERMRDVIAQGYDSWLGLSRCAQAMVPGFGAVSEVVVIAVCGADEALALDYSVGPQPRVVITVDHRWRALGPRWMEIATCFDELAEILRLRVRGGRRVSGVALRNAPSEGLGRGDVAAHGKR